MVSDSTRSGGNTRKHIVAVPDSCPRRYADRLPEFDNLRILRNNVPETYQATQNHLDAMWKEIRVHTQLEYMLTLRAAANILGLWRFPIGWTWTEFRRALEPPLPYEKKASASHRLDLDLPPDSDKTTEDVADHAAAYRMTEVERYLKRFIDRHEVANALYDEEGNGRPFPDELRYTITRIHIPRSAIRHRDGKSGCFVDGLALLDTLDVWRNEIAKNQKKKPKYNWFAVERHLRDRLEARGTADSDNTVVMDAMEWYAERYGKDQHPTRATLAELARRLRVEHEFPIDISEFNRKRRRY